MTANSISTTQPERRQSLKLRMLFPEVSAYLRAVFHQHPDWAGTSQDFVALRAIHERWSDLSSHEVRTLVTATARKLNAQSLDTKLVA